MSRFATRPIVGVLDLGSTKVCAAIARSEGPGRMELMGFAQAPSKGMRQGMVRDVPLAVASVRQAIALAERQAGVQVRDWTIGLSGAHVSCVNRSALVEVANPTRGVGEAERRRVLERARATTMQDGREVAMLISQEFLCDEQRGIRDPMGMACQRLEARVHVVSAAISAIRNVARCVELAGRRTAGFVPAGWASSLPILSEDEREIGVLLIDIGGGTSDVALLSGGAVRYTGVVPLGGEAITRDLAHAMRISRADAEHLKRFAAHPDATNGREMTVNVRRLVGGQSFDIPWRDVRDVLAARCEEILLEVKGLIEATPWRDAYPGGVVLTGGSAQVAGIEEIARRVLKADVRLGTPGPTTGALSCPDSPVFSTVAGLLQHAIEEESSRRSSRSRHWRDRLLVPLTRFLEWYA